MARQPGNILALDWYESHGLKAMIATATNTEGGMLFQQDERDKGNGFVRNSFHQEFYSACRRRKISPACFVLPGMINRRTWKTTGGDLLQPRNTAGLHPADHWRNMITPG